jgi:hypothetical protein
MTSWTRVGVAVAALLLAGGIAACGSDEDEGAAEAQKVVEDIQSLREGEILIKGSKPRIYGPYDFERAGYDLRFEHGSGARLVVTLESERETERPPFQLVVDTTARTGTGQVTVHGKLYVHVRASRGAYTLRFTPR